MRKKLCLALALSMLMVSSTAVLAKDIAADDSSKIAREAENSAAEKASEYVSDISDFEVMEACQSITLENVSSGSSQKTRVVRVRYDESRFTDGIKSFTVKLSLPALKINKIESTTTLDSVISDEYDSYNNTYTCTVENTENSMPADGALFTMVIEFEKNLPTETSISLLSGTVISDGTVTDSIDDGSMLGYSLSLPASSTAGNVLGCGNSGDFGGFSWVFDENETLTITGQGEMKGFEPNGAPWYGESVIKHVIIESNGSDIKSIGSYVFEGLTDLKDITLPNGLEIIGDGAFSGCENLEYISFESSLRAIGKSAFKDCKTLKMITVPSSVTSIGAGAFDGCVSLESLRLPFVGNQVGITDKAEAKFDYIFNGNVPTSIKSVEITNDTDIVDEAFADCGSLETITLNNSVSSIGEAAFEGCGSLKSFIIPESVTVVKSRAFKNCASAASIILHDKIENIGESAFENCVSLVQIDAEGENIIPEKVSVVNDYTFKNCASLKKLVIDSNVTSIGIAVLEGCTGLENLVIPFVGASGSLDTSAVVSYTRNYSIGYLFSDSVTQSTQSDIVPASLTMITVRNDGKYDAIPAYAFYGCNNIVNIDVQGGTAVYNSAFEGCANLKTLYLPRTVTSIGSNILVSARTLETLTVPFIGNQRGAGNATGDIGCSPDTVLGYFFGYSEELMYPWDILQVYDNQNHAKYFHIPKTLKNVVVLSQTTIPYGAFSYCTSLEKVAITTAAQIGERAFYNCGYIESIKLPNDMTTINDETFAECYSLKSINIPARVQSIGDAAFYNDRSLREITIPESVSIINENTFNGIYELDSDWLSVMEDNLPTIYTTPGSYASSYGADIGFNVVEKSSAEIDATTPSIVIDTLDNLDTNITVTADEAGVVYVACYDKNGAVVSVKSVEKESMDKASVVFTADEIQNAEEVKAFVWEGMKNKTNAAIEQL